MSVAKVRPRKEGWGIVTESVMLNKKMSSDARFLIAMVATLPPNWKFYISWLRAHTGWGKDKLQNVMRELKKNGHLIRTRLAPSKDKEDEKERGGFSWEYEFLLEPDSQAIEQEPENQAIENQATENTANNKKRTINKRINNNRRRERAPVQSDQPSVEPTRPLSTSDGMNVDSEPVPTSDLAGATPQSTANQHSPDLGVIGPLKAAIKKVCGLTRDSAKLTEALEHCASLEISPERVFEFERYWHESHREKPLPLRLQFILEDIGGWTRGVEMARSRPLVEQGRSMPKTLVESGIRMPPRI